MNAATDQPTASGHACLQDPTGLHARPAVKLTKLAKGFDAAVEVRAGEVGTWVNAKSPNAVMKLMAAHGETLYFRAMGDDADRAVADLVRLVELDFGEGANGERVLAGIAAAGGLAFGTIVVEQVVTGTRRAGKGPRDGAHDLRDAVGRAKAELGRLIDTGDRLAAEVLEYQCALLADDDLMAPVYAAIASGTIAESAWTNALDREIAALHASPDATFKARADDLLDLRARVLRALGGESPSEIDLVDGAIYVADTLTPSRFLELDWARCRGAAMCGGSPTSHVAILARARGVPLVVGLGPELLAVPPGTPVVIDAENGRLIVAPKAATLRAMEHRIGVLAGEAREAARFSGQAVTTAAGVPVRVMINVDDPAALDTLAADACDGVGLTRTEFMVHGAGLPDEDTQLRVYRRILAWADGRPVTIRTLDAGGDKPIAGLTVDGEDNPFLGVRGLRLSLGRPDVFRVQLRALARAAAHGPLKIMLPMVTAPAEFDAARRMLGEVVADIARTGAAHAMPALGMMVEVPAAALTAEMFDADFYSIGSNDLIQYTTASARDNAAVAGLADPRNPAVLELIRRTVEAGRRRGVEVSLCGDMASDPALVPVLLDCGLLILSVAPALVDRVKLAVSRHGA